MKKLLLFDVDGTIAESGQKINKDIAKLLNNYENNSLIEIGIVGGGKLDKILWQTDEVKFHHYFSECGCVYNKLINDKLELIYEKDIREHNLYSSINILIKFEHAITKSINSNFGCSKSQTSS